MLVCIEKIQRASGSLLRRIFIHRLFSCLQHSLCLQCATLGPLALPVQVYRHWIKRGLDIDIVPRPPPEELTQVRIVGRAMA